MANAALFAHGCSRDAHEQITQLSDFMSPTIIAMWNLRWHVQGFLSAVPDASQKDLASRFAARSGYHGNELKRACTQVSWQEQQNRFASILLTNTIAIFEDFVEALTSLTLTGSTQENAAKHLQFPVGGARDYVKGYALIHSPAPELTNVFSASAKAGKWYSLAHLQNLLLCYRFFKELRNCTAHNGGRSSQKLIDAYTAFSAVATSAALGVKDVPEYKAPILGHVINPTIIGIHQFSNIVLRIIATYDADFSESVTALTDATARLKAIPPHNRQHWMDDGKKQSLIRGMVMNSGFPEPKLTPAFLGFLRASDRIPSYW